MQNKYLPPVVPLLVGAHLFSSVCTQGFISGSALITPWAMKRIVPTALVISLNFDAGALAYVAPEMCGNNYFFSLSILSLPPRTAVETSVLNGFCDVLRLDVFRAL